MIISRLTSKAQTTIPQAVRFALNVKEGDSLAYEIREDGVVLSKAPQGPPGDPFATFDEWGSDVDSKAYGQL